MDRRTHPRHAANTEGWLTVLDPPSSPVAVVVEEMSQRGARLKLGAPLPPGAPVRLEVDDSLMLGECVRCEGSPESGYLAGLHLDQALHQLADLKRLMQCLFEESENIERQPH